MPTRRDQILETAATLFAERGFHGVSVHDIGAACGISGPAIYKHFAGKDDLLAQSLTSISERHVTEAAERVGSDVETSLDALLEWHVSFALEHPALIVIQEREWSNLDPVAQAAVRDLQLTYIDTWVGVLRDLRPALDRAAARARVQAMFGLLNSTPHSARLGREAMTTLLTRMARAALLVT